MTAPRLSGAEIVAHLFDVDMPTSQRLEAKLAALVDAVAHDYAVHSAMFNGCRCAMCAAYHALIEEAKR